MKTISSKDFDKLCRGCLRAVVLTERIARVAEMIEYCTNEKVFLMSASHFHFHVSRPK